MMIEMGKKYQTRDGRAVRILAILDREAWPVVGIIYPIEGRGFEDLGIWTREGKSENCGEKSITDLIPVSTKHVRWALMDTHSGQVKGYRYDTKAEADAECRLEPEYNEAVVCLTWED
jgi:hypothetical protein